MSTTWESDEAVFHLFRSGQPADTNIRGWHQPSCQVRDPLYGAGTSSPRPYLKWCQTKALVSYWPLAGWHHNYSIKYRGARGNAARGIRTAGWDLVSLQRRLLRCEQSPIAVAE